MCTPKELDPNQAPDSCLWVTTTTFPRMGPGPDSSESPAVQPQGKANPLILTAPQPRRHGSNTTNRVWGLGIE